MQNSNLSRRAVFGALTLAAVLFASSACNLTTVSKNFNGTTTSNGAPRVYQNTTNYAVHLGMGYYPVIGNATVDGGVDAFTKDARKNGGTKTDITNMSANNLWYIFPPFTFIITPVVTDTYGYVYR